MPRIFYKALALVLGSLGLACGGDSGPGPVEYAPMPEYGIPFARYILSGQVVKATDVSPLSGMQVGFLDARDTTDTSGRFSIDITDMPCDMGDDRDCALSIHDIDSTAGGGLFADTLVELSLTQTDPGDGQYDLGTYEQTNLEIRLDEESE